MGCIAYLKSPQIQYKVLHTELQVVQHSVSLVPLHRSTEQV